MGKSALGATRAIGGRLGKSFIKEIPPLLALTPPRVVPEFPTLCPWKIFLFPLNLSQNHCPSLCRAGVYAGFKGLCWNSPNLSWRLVLFVLPAWEAACVCFTDAFSIITRTRDGQSKATEVFLLYLFYWSTQFSALSFIRERFWGRTASQLLHSNTSIPIFKLNLEKKTQQNLCGF